MQLDRKEVELKQKLEVDDAGKSDEIISDVLKLREIFWIMKTLDWSKQINITILFSILWLGCTKPRYKYLMVVFGPKHIDPELCMNMYSNFDLKNYQHFLPWFSLFCLKCLFFWRAYLLSVNNGCGHDIYSWEVCDSWHGEKIIVTLLSIIELYSLYYVSYELSFVQFFKQLSSHYLYFTAYLHKGNSCEHGTQLKTTPYHGFVAHKVCFSVCAIWLPYIFP